MHRKVSTALLNSLIILSTLLALVLSAVGVTPAQAAPADDATSPLTLADLPIAAQPAVSDALGRGNTDYHFVPGADGYRVENAAHSLVTDFSPAGMTLRSGDTHWTLALQAVGYGETLEAVTGAEPTIGESANRLEYTRGNLTEWYINGPFGLEQGFTLASRPAVDDVGALTLAFAMDGNVQPRLNSNMTALELVNEDGGTVFRYGGLHAYDAGGKTLRAWMESPADGTFQIRVDDTGARYPLTIDPLIQQAYLKASNTGEGDLFGNSVAISGDTLVVGAHDEDSNATGVDGDGSDNSVYSSGAVYVFMRSGGTWSQQAYLKASNTGANDNFGRSVAISGDTIVVGAPGESSNATGVNGNQSDNSAYYSGAVYVFTRSGTTWSQQAYLKASNTGEFDDRFGISVAISGDTIVVGADGEDSNATGVNGNQSDNSAPGSGAVYVFTRSGTTWSQQAYLKASNTGVFDVFGWSVAISGDTIVVGAQGESSNATGVNGNQSDNSAYYSGAAYVFTCSGGTWSQQAYLKASNTGAEDWFGQSVAISGNTLVVGAYDESSNATGVNGNQSDNSATGSGAAYVFTRSGTTWSQQAYLKASNTGADDSFGWSVAISGDALVVGAMYEDSNATGVDGDGSDNSATDSGAAYVFARSGDIWSQQAYLKASNTGQLDLFGDSVAISGDTLVVGAPWEESNAAGAAYTFLINHTVTPLAGAGGSISPNTPQTVNTGATTSFTVTPSTGYFIANVTGCGGSLSGNTYTTGPITADCTVTASFSTPAPVVQSITLAGINPIDGAGLDFTVTFDKPVTGVDKDDFTLTKTGSIMGAAVTRVVPVNQSVYTVTVNSGIGNGSIRLDLPATATIQNLSANVFVGPYTGGETYTIKGLAPTVPVLKLPKNKSLVTTNTPTLDWSDSSQVMALATGWHYEIQVTAPFGVYDETFNTQDSADPAVGLGASTFTIPADKSLPENTTFTWRVRAFDAAYRYSAWSKQFTFRTGTPVTPPTEDAPTVPVLKSPKNKSLVATYMPILDWNASIPPATATAGCLYYEVRVTSPYRNYNASFTTAGSEYTIPAENILPANSIFTWQVRSACNDGATIKYSAWSKGFTFRTKLATPTLLSPIDDAVTPLDNIRPTFTWEPVSGTAAYTLQVLKDGKVVVTGKVKAPAYSFTPKKDLLPDTTYTWKVKANGKNPGDYSATNTFVTGASASAIPTPTAPKKNALVESADEQTLTWSLVDNATPALSYQVEYATNKAFTESVIVPAADMQLVLPGGTLLPGRTYYWRVRSLSVAGNHSAWSKALAIKVKFVAPVLDSVTVTDGSPTFVWHSDNGLWKNYMLLVLDSTTNKVVKSYTVPAPIATYTIPAAMLPAGTYKWQVKINGLYTPISSAVSADTFTK